MFHKVDHLAAKLLFISDVKQPQKLIYPLKIDKKTPKIIAISYYKPTYLSLTKAEVYNRISFISSF